MRWRLVASLGLGVSLGLGLACSSPGFACERDDQCVLAGEPGSCVAGGHCAYADPECSSGLSYPQGAPDDLAGKCVSGEAMGSGSGGTASDSEGVSTDTDPEPGTGDGSSSGGPRVCEDLYEPNDDALQASVVALGEAGDCLASWEALIEDSLDEDWYQIETSDPSCALTSELTFVTDPPLQLCAVPQCANIVAPMISACDGSMVPLEAGMACCNLDEVRMTVDCDGTAPTIFLGVAPSFDTPACLPYEAAVFL